jgi:hypothetical protein
MRRAQWLHGPVTDTALALAWLPLAVLAHVMSSTPTHLRVLVGLIFLLSFAHQPLTLALVYGDRAQLEARRRLYLAAPVVLCLAVVAGLYISLTTVAVVAGLWNAEHTLMQRYGLTRIYGRKAGDDNGHLEKRMIISWLVLAMVFVAAFVDLEALVTRIGMGGTNARGVHLLAELRPMARWLFVPVVIAVVSIGAKWYRAERALGDRANPAKHVYLAATAALIAVVLIDPIAGFAGYVGGHALEYFVIVHRSLRTRAAHGDVSAIATATATAGRRALTYVAYAVAIVALVWLSWDAFDGRIYRFLILFLGGLHILYDGFIWKLRRPALAASLGVPSRPEPSAAASVA